MKTIKVKCIGREVSKEVPSKVAEFSKLGMTEEQVVDQCNRYITYHVWMGSVRELLQEKLEDETRVERMFEYSVLKDGSRGEARVYTEKFEEYVAALLKNDKITQGRLNTLIDESAAETAYEAASPRQRKDVDLERRMKMAKEILASEEKTAKLRKKCAALEVELGDEPFTEEAVAKAIAELEAF